MRAAALLAMCACNRVFGIAATVAWDAGQYDATIDAPYACPPLGTTPVFSPQLHQIQANCTSYSASAVTGRAVASCIEASERVVSEGPLDGPFVAIAVVPAPNNSLTVSEPHLAPDGDLLFVSTFDLVKATGAFLQFQRSANGDWTRIADLPGNGLGRVTAPTRGPDRHLLYLVGLTSDIEEWADGTGAWTKIATHPLGELGISSIGPTWLSPDGLRIVAVASAATPMTEYLV